MKVPFYTCLALAGALLSHEYAQAQTINNLNLDAWATRNGVEAPANWLTTDDDFAYAFGQPLGTFNFGAVTKTTDKHGGTYAAKLTTGNVTIGTSSGPVPGELILGAKTGVYSYLGYCVSGTPLAARPAQMQFYYKLTGSAVAADSALALVYATKTTNGVPAVIGRGYQFLLTPTTTYTQLTVPITYSSTNTATPDSIHVVFSSGYAENVTAGTALFIDDVTISGVNLSAQAAAGIQEKLTVSPNPGTGGRFIIHSPDAPKLASGSLIVSDIMGRTVVHQSAQTLPSGERELDLSALPVGTYLLRLDSEQGIIVRQITIQ
ncbi:MAG: T9SS type A sorting domain-containing protein [Janthinobacterium lividum]